LNVIPAGWVLNSAVSINNNGDIAGYGTTGSGQSRGFIIRAWLPGDANGDGKVDVTDLSKVLTNYNKSGMQWADGDFDGSGTVDVTDLSKVLTDYNKGLGSSSAAMRTVPEPGAPALLAGGLLGLLASARRKRK
jgi:hypothetical protein